MVKISPIFCSRLLLLTNSEFLVGGFERFCAKLFFPALWLVSSWHETDQMAFEDDF